MAFYNNVKDRVRDQNTDSTGDDTDDSEGDTVAFDELIKKAQEQDDNDEKEQQDDDTEIEDFSGGTKDTGDYGDPSSIELNEDGDPQAGRQDTTESNETEDRPASAATQPSSKTETGDSSQSGSR